MDKELICKIVKTICCCVLDVTWVVLTLIMCLKFSPWFIFLVLLRVGSYEEWRGKY